jgi:porin
MFPKEFLCSNKNAPGPALFGMTLCLNNYSDVMKTVILTFILLILAGSSITGQETEESQVNYSVDTTFSESDDKLRDRTTLTGNWGGLRSKLKEKGFIFKASFTNFYQGMVSGEGNKDLEFGSKFGFTTIFNGEKIGLWKGFFAIARMEYNMGQSVNSRGGTLLPVNTALAYPGMEGADRWDMNIYFIQFLSKTDKIVLGKINNIDLSNFSTFGGGLGLKNFYHQALVSPPNAITVPYVFGGYYMSGNEKRDLTFAVYDSNNRVNKMGFEGLFEDGVTFFGSFDLVTNFFGKKGKQGILGAYSTKDVRNTEDIEDFFPPTGDYIGEKGNRWVLTYFFEQTLYQNSNNPKHAFGLFCQLGITDGVGSLSDLYMVLGLGGNSPISKRPLDKWGLGYFNYSLSDGISNLNIPSIPGVYPGLTMSNGESGFEVFYEAWLTRWISLGIDYQYVSPGFESVQGVSNSGVSFLGFRSMIRL